MRRSSFPSLVLLFLLAPVVGCEEGPTAPDARPKEKVHDVGKRTIEMPIKRLIDPKPGRDDHGARDLNPRVAPGAVDWYGSFAEACQASEKSGRPVLLFQLLGRLDRRWT